MNYKYRFVNVFMDHSKMFMEIKAEKTAPAIAFYASLILALLAVDWALLSVGLVPANLSVLKQIPLTDYLILYTPVYFFVLNFLGLFFFGGFALVFSRVFGIKTTAPTVVKVFAYASTPFILAQWIPAFNAVCLAWSAYLISKGLAEINNSGFRKSFYVVILAGIFTGIVTFFGVYLISLNLGIDLNLERIFISRS